MIKYFLFIILFIFILNNDNYVYSFHGGKELTKLQQIQQASFRFLISSAYRNSQKSREWCEDEKVAGGRPYKWSDYRNCAISYIDLYIALQFDNSCKDQLMELRKIYKDNEAQPTPYNDDPSFWDSILLPKMLDAFSCGFNGSTLDDHEFVSSDLLNNFDNSTIQKVWFMVEDYMLSIYKQRENVNRRLDFDSGLYIPYLDRFTSVNYTRDQNMRVGFPTYIGRSLWHIFHTVAQRISDSDCNQDQYDIIFEKFNNFMVYFAKGVHPCPFCLNHFIGHVLVNDMYANDPLESEAIRMYPIEHILMGGTAGNAIAKLSTIKSSDKKSIAAFFWKLHNTVSSSVEASCSCFMEETYDTDPYKCIFSGEVIQQARYPRQQRSYPFMKRFEFILTPSHNYTLFKDTRDSFKSITTEINQLDTLKLRSELFWFWKNGTKISNDTQSSIDKLMVLIDQMTNDFLSTPVLSVYSYPLDAPLVCNDSFNYLNSTDNSNLQAPSLQFDHQLPTICLNKTIPSACTKQYKTNITTIIKEEEQGSSTHSNSIQLSINYIMLISIIIISILFKV